VSEVLDGATFYYQADSDTAKLAAVTAKLAVHSVVFVV